MLLIDGHWYELPDGTRVRATKVGGSPGWYLLCDDCYVPCYGVYTFGLHQFVFDPALGDYRGMACDLTISDLRQATAT
jgi:hypothetical protein